MKHSTIKIKTLFNASTILILLLGWIIISSLQQNEYIFPKISAIVKEMGMIISTWSSIKTLIFSFGRTILAVIIGFLLSFIVIMLYIWKKNTIAFFEPILYFMRSAPVAAISIFIFILIGDTVGPFFISTLVIFPIIVSGMKTAVDQVDPHILDELAMLNISFLRAFFQIYIPIMFSYLIMLLIQTFGLGFKVMVMGEYICQTSNSIGKSLYIAKANIDMASLLGWTIIIVIIVGVIETLLYRWNHRYLLD